MINYGKQNINEEDIEAVINVLKSDFLTQGPIIEQFEQKVAQYCGARYAVAVSNATAALHIACLSAGLKKNEVVWTSPNTFVASANCALYCGGKVDFVDINESTYNMDVNMLEKKLKKTEIKPKIVIPVHFAGQSCEMEKIYELSKKYGFKIIEDASHAIGAEYKFTKVGSCKYSDMTVFSFHPVKIITTGEGGMVLTNSEELYEKLKLYRSHGITRNKLTLGKKTDEPWYYEQIDLGFNYRMTDMQAALGISQMNRLDSFIEKRSFLAERYNELFKNPEITIPYQHFDTKSSWHLYVIKIDFKKISKVDFFKKMKLKRINLNLHYIPVHIQPFYHKLGFKEGDYPNSEKYYNSVITIPLFFDLSEKQQEYIVKSLNEVLLNA